MGKKPQAAIAVPDYDRLWKEVYGDIQSWGPVHKHMRRIMRAYLRNLDYSSVLDVGCGFGHNLPLLTDGRGLDRVGGIDFSETALAEVRRVWGSDFHNVDIEKGHLQVQYDLVCCSLVMEHVLDDVAVLRNLRAMCNKYLLVTTIAGNYDRYQAWETRMGHVRNYRRGELEKKMRDAGFEVDRATYWGYPFYSPIGRMMHNKTKFTGQFGASTKVLAAVTDLTYRLNWHSKGDLLVVLAKV